MSIDHIEYHPPVDVKPSRLQRVAHVISTGGFSFLEVEKQHLDEDKRLALESSGYEPLVVQGYIDLVQNGQGCEIAAAVLRGALNNLVDRVNQLALESPAN